MACVTRIPLLTLFYLYIFSNILITHQTDEDVKRLVRLDSYLVNGRNPLRMNKCPDNSEFVFLQGFAVCKKNLNNFDANTRLWMVTEHVKPESGVADTTETYKNSANEMIKAYYGYCEEFFNKNQECVLDINKEEETASRFQTEYNLECSNTALSVYNGTMFCVEKLGSPVGEGETVTLVGYHGKEIEVKCPAEKKIKTVTAFEYSAPVINKGLVNSFYDDALEACEGKERCALSVTDTDKFKRFRVYTYKCV